MRYVLISRRRGHRRQFTRQCRNAAGNKCNDTLFMYVVRSTKYTYKKYNCIVRQACLRLEIDLIFYRSCLICCNEVSLVSTKLEIGSRSRTEKKLINYIFEIFSHMINVSVGQFFLYSRSGPISIVDTRLYIV